MNNSFLFGGISVIIIGDFLQIPPNKLQVVYTNAKKEWQQALNGSLWEIFLTLFKLIEIVYVRLKQLALTDTSL